jgi:hypothetical protein
VWRPPARMWRPHATKCRHIYLQETPYGSGVDAGVGLVRGARGPSGKPLGAYSYANNDARITVCLFPDSWD